MAYTKKSNSNEINLIESILWESCCGYWLLPEHLERLKRSAASLSIPLDENHLDQELETFTRDLDSSPQLIHVNVNNQGKLNFSAEPTIEERRPYNVTLAASSIDKNDSLLCHNTTDRSLYDNALSTHTGFDDVILWNSDDEITESCTGNIVVEINDCYYTPPVSCGLIPGTYRAELIKQGTITEKIIKLEQLKDYSKIYIINSAVGWREAILNLE